MTHQFKAGDSVVCVRDTELPKGRLTKGNVYRVFETTLDNVTRGHLRVVDDRGNKDWYYVDRFRPAPSPEGERHEGLVELVSRYWDAGARTSAELRLVRTGPA